MNRDDQQDPAPRTAVQPDSRLGEGVNRSLDDMVGLLEREIARLKESLETYRLSRHPERVEIIRWHVKALDDRQDALEDLKLLIIAGRDGASLD